MPWPNAPCWLGDLVTVLENPATFVNWTGAPVGAFGTDLFTSTKSEPPLLPSGTVTLVETGGTSADRTHNSLIRPAMVRPGAQITARAKDYETARVKAHLVYDVLVQIRNQFINSGLYLDVMPLQEPFDGGLDKRGQAQCMFNVLGRVAKRLW